MLGQQYVRVTYARKRRRVQDASKKLLSSPLEVLPPEMDDLTRTQMARRMLKRSRRVALAEQLEDKNVEHIREHLAKRIKRTRERASNVEPTGVPLDMHPQDDITFQTPLTSPQSVHESAVTKPLVPEQLSPVPAVKRVMSRTSSKNLKENSAHSQTLASPFSSRPGSTASSPKHNDRGRSSRRVSRGSFHPKSRTLSGVFKENARRLSRKGSTVSLKDTNRKHPARHAKHQRYPSSPSTPYMRSQFTQEDWIAPPKAILRTFYDDDEIPSTGGSVHSNASFYADQPQSCSTPAISRLRKLPDLHGCQTRTGNHLASFSLRKDSIEAGGVELLYGTVSPQRQTVHLSGNSIFSSSDEFTIGSLPIMNNGTSRDELPAHVSCQAATAVERTQAGHTLAGSFIAEYDIPLSDLAYSPASTAATKTLGPEGVPKLSVGAQPFSLPGTSPACGKSLIIRTYRNPGTLTPPSSPYKTTASCPSSPASDLALGFRSMDIHVATPLNRLSFINCISEAGGLDTHDDGETHRPPSSIPLQMRSHSLQDALAESTTKKAVKGRSARNRAGTIRASDFVKPGVSLSSAAPGLTISSPANVRRTRSGTIVGPDSKLATKGAGLRSRAARGALTSKLAAVHSGSESGSDDELLLKTAWIEDLEYLGLAMPQSRKDAEADEMNLGGLWHGLESGPPRPLGLRRR